ncbi:hypothetical protein [Malikia spinosa]|uniref:Uncharacterized protein n=1 Tax=Malikia spinosa TaxID=86180 RepID=A0A7C9NXQ2_9BURK|nr:hypothetical protein [Malikia spinosa]MYZ53684.1 hypothetical protein [Malikia spinosa]
MNTTFKEPALHDMYTLYRWYVDNRDCCMLQAAEAVDRSTAEQLTANERSTLMDFREGFTVNLKIASGKDQYFGIVGLHTLMHTEAAALFDRALAKVNAALNMQRRAAN